MNIDNAKSQMRKGMLEYCIMLLLRHRAAYASDIIANLKEAELIVVEGTLYPLLTRLKKDGLLGYEWQESTQGPPRKYYSLTPEGEATLSELDKAWLEIAHTVNVLNLKSATKLFSVLLASKRPLITELADKLRLKYPLLPTISPCPTMRLEAIRSIIPISCRRYPKSV